MQVIAFTYESGAHCVDCAKARFGNPMALCFLGAVHDIDERVDDLWCDTCRQLIAESTLSQPHPDDRPGFVEFPAGEFPPG